MPIIRNSDQTATLEDFYGDLIRTSTHEFYSEGAKNMLKLIHWIDEVFRETKIWGLTSASRLVLQNKDDWRSDWYVIFCSGGQNEYYFEYLLPVNKQPWENAYVKGTASCFDDAQKYLLIAMRESRGWPNNDELLQLLNMHQ